MALRKAKKEFSVEAILGQLLTPFRRELAGRVDQVVQAQQQEREMRAQMEQMYAQAKEKNPDLPPMPPVELPPAFSEDDFNDFVSRVKMLLPDPTYFRDELENVRAAITTGLAPREPHFTRPETQLLWGAALLLMQANIRNYKMPQDEPASNGDPQQQQLPLQEPEPLTDVSELPVWYQITESEAGESEFRHHAFYLMESTRSDQIRFGWGEPGTGFGYNEEREAIIVDLAMSLIAGLEHTRALMLQQIGRFHLSTGLPPRMQQIGERMMELKDKQEDENGEGLDEAEYKELRLLAVQWELWSRLNNAAEQNTANRYAARKSENLSQNYGYSLNHALTTLTPYGAIAQEYLSYLKQGQIPVYDAAPADAGTAFMNVVNAVELSFFKNNFLFDNNEAGWNKLGVEPKWI